MIKKCRNKPNLIMKLWRTYLGPGTVSSCLSLIFCQEFSIFFLLNYCLITENVIRNFSSDYNGLGMSRPQNHRENNVRIMILPFSFLWKIFSFSLFPVSEDSQIKEFSQISFLLAKYSWNALLDWSSRRNFLWSKKS